ncbi:zona pellucida sperm-binding protein 2-like [Erpetoichthys calabaricus]|uniref:zona pellucida sperm-binding protein 2-like n=1 Tax=Erpetoichthys calabaricus TaxID=27687 RepID=UPI00223499AB|nr:zona pellucida sperm-binding protein 2-like [Erpetoichthys calabaricus]
MGRQLLCVITTLLALFGCRAEEGHVICSSNSMTLEMPPDAVLDSDRRVYVIDLNTKGSLLLDDAALKKCKYTQQLTPVYLLKAGFDSCGVQYKGGVYILYVQVDYYSSSLSRAVSRTFKVSCSQPQADNPPQAQFLSGATNCTPDFMEAQTVQVIPSFDSVGGGTWYVQVKGPKGFLMGMKEAQANGYTFYNVDSFVVARVRFNAKGVQKLASVPGGQTLYLADFSLWYSYPVGRITISFLLLCVPSAITCSQSGMSIILPTPNLKFQKVKIGSQVYTSHPAPTAIHLIIVSTFVRIAVPFSYPLMSNKPCPGGMMRVLPITWITFSYKSIKVDMMFNPTCPCQRKGQTVVSLCQNGLMSFEVNSNATQPALNLTSAQLLDPSCQPSVVSATGLMYSFPLMSCGTTTKMLGGRLVYENEVRVMPQTELGIITRDSEFILTVLCYYNDSADRNLSLAVLTNAPPAPAVNQGNLTVVLRAYPDEMYRIPYRDKDYPVVKYLRNPIYLEVQVLNRQDPNIELVLENCWATASPNPVSLPRWTVIAAGCAYGGDDYPTVMHPMSSFTGIQFPSHYKRFDVKAFAFVSSGAARSSAVYFHCSALICDIANPDSTACASICPVTQPIRFRRSFSGGQDRAVLGEVVSSLPGPVAVMKKRITKAGMITTDSSSKQLKVQTGQLLWTTLLVVGVVLMVATLAFACFASGFQRNKFTK